MLNILLLPLAYIKGIYVTLQQTWTNKIESPMSYRILRFMLFLFFGIFILLLNFGSDFIAFIIHNYQNNMKYRKIQKKSLKISSKSYVMIQRMFDEHNRRGSSIIQFGDFVVAVRDEMNVFDYIVAMIYSNNKDLTPKICMELIDEYVLIKRILKS